MNTSRSPEAVHATRIGAHALRRIAAPSSLGHVVSTFADGVNVRFDGAPPVLVAIQTAGVAFHPWAVEVRVLSADLACGATVRTAAPTPASDACLVLHVRGAKRCTLRIAPYSRQAAARARSRVAQLETPFGGEAFRGPSEPFASSLLAALAEWRTRRSPSALLSLVGLGSGSTPAGDDLLVGLLAGLTALRRAERQAARHLKTLRGPLSEVSLRTSPASRQMIAAAADGSFPEPIRELVSALARVDRASEVQACAARVFALGASSGESFVTGLKTALDSTFRGAGPPSSGPLRIIRRLPAPRQRVSGTTGGDARVRT